MQQTSAFLKQGTDTLRASYKNNVNGEIFLKTGTPRAIFNQELDAAYPLELFIRAGG